MLLLPLPAMAEATRGYSWPHSANAETIEQRFAPPPGFARVAVTPGGFADWLRHLPLKPAGAPVLLYDGRRKADQTRHAAVVDIDVGRRDLQQCADSVIRLRAEYLYAGDPAERAGIAFAFTSGDRVSFARWAEGWRPVVSRNRVSWRRDGARGMGRAQLAAYLATIFAYAGTQSLERELVPVPPGSLARGGDIFIEGGFPGHAVIVVDVAADPNGRRVMLLAQGFMPAQSLHVIKNPKGGVWYDAAAGDPETPEWRFKAGHARRFAEPAP
ncbi:MAG: DUF4846 domain-containing protein [Rhodospirillaceae bacterium]|nr:DUF4846 domain-containing protein [Rhodospirillaceae bacterium]